MDNLDRVLEDSMNRIEKPLPEGHQQRFMEKMDRGRRVGLKLRLSLSIAVAAASIVLFALLFSVPKQEGNLLESDELRELITYSDRQMDRIVYDILSMEHNGVDAQEFAKLEEFTSEITSAYQQLKSEQQNVEPERFKMILYSCIKRNIKIADNIINKNR